LGQSSLSLEKLASDLHGWANLFQTGSLPKVSSILENVSEKMKSGQIDDRMLGETLTDLQKSFWDEFCGGVGWKKDILDDIAAILKKGSPKLDLAMTILQRTKSPQDTLMRVSVAAMGQKDALTQLYLLAFLYLVLIEGIYDETMRFLYALHLHLSSSNTGLDEIKKRFIQDKVGLSLFNGWNRTVRNGIAHATFSLDPNTNTAQFDDQITKKTETLTFDGFRTLSQKLFDVPTAVQLLLILQVLAPANFHFALEAAKKA